jgi:hypothetical protein
MHVTVARHGKGLLESRCNFRGERVELSQRGCARCPDAPQPTRDMKRRILALSFLLLACALAAASVGYLDAMNVRRSALALPEGARPARPVTTPPEAAPRRVILVVIDGLRLDVSESLPFLNALRAQGVAGRASALFPSLSRPSYAVMASGTTPDRTGVRNNRFAVEVGVDHALARARDAGLGVSGAANLPWWHQNYRASFTSWHEAPRSYASFEAAARRALEGPESLFVLHVVDLDAVAHREGAGAAYRKQALDVDATLAGLFAAVDLGRDAVIVTSDHGHRDAGGHGGTEPEVLRVPMVLAGRGVRRDGVTLEVGPLAGVGPTLTTLLGIEHPRDATAPPCIEALDPAVLGEAYLAARRVDFEAQRAAYDAGLATLGRSDAGPGGAARLVARASALALAVAFAAWARRVRDRRVFLSLPLVGLAAFGTLRLLGYPFSFSAIVTVAEFLGVLALAACAGVGALVGFVVLRKRGAPRRERLEAVRDALGAAGLAYAAVAPIAWALFGYRVPGSLPAPGALFLPLPAAFLGGATCAVAAVAFALIPAGSATQTVTETVGA